MAIYYILLFVSALIFSLQFLITRQYQRRNGTGFVSSVRLSLFAYLAIALFFFIKGSVTMGQINFGFSWFTLLMTLLVSVVGLSCVYMGIKVLAVGDMSIYSVFMMLGSLLLPSLVGLIFYGEELTLIKGIAFVCMFSAIVLSVSSIDKSKLTLKAFLYYVGIFVMNGMIGVLFTVHQNQPKLTASVITNADGSFALNNDVFMTWYGLSTVILCSVVYLVFFIMQKVKGRKNAETLDAVTESKAVGESVLKGFLITVALAAAYGLCNGLGDYFIALATQPHALGSSVTFPIINGGTILFSTVVGIVLYKEKLKPTTIVSLVLVIVATVLFMFV